ncbi:hypothetical protein [Prauserella marina]|uniref:hypothetical protein n=1 Tax=Prauserella marina TaxID=530584 RepID=UPI00115FDD17|nr:hypothetical protein [Prauserella marina]
MDRHLGCCVSCRLWWEQAGRLHRGMRLASAPSVPDLTDRIVAAAPLPRRDRWGLRLALTVVALLQASLGFAQLLGVDATHAEHAVAATHLGNESAAWNLAIGIGLLWAALRPTSAGGLLPALTGFAVVLAVVSASDLFGGLVTGARVVSHGIMLAGVVLLFFVHRQHKTNDPSPVADAEPAWPNPEPASPRDNLARTLRSARGSRSARGPVAKRDAA